MKIFYGWRMVFAGGAIQFLQNGLLHQAFGAYFAVLIEEKGWSKTALSGAAALQPVEAAVLGPVLGWIVDRFGPQGMIRTGIITFGIGFMLLSQIDTLAGFYGAFITIALGSSLCGFFPLQVAIIYWFEKRRARALSLLSLGAALGGIFVLAVAWSIQSFGWRATAFASGVLVILVGFPLARVFRGRPEDHGETIDGLPPAATEVADTEASTQREFSTREALGTSAFWLISLGHSFALLIVYAVLVHAITHMKETLGYSVSEGSLVITLLTITQVVGIMLGWLIGDRVEKRLLAAFSMLMHACGLLLLTYATGPVMLGAFVILHGVAWGLRGPLMQAMRADYFGRRSIGMIMGLSSVIIVTGQIGGPMIAAVLADWTGNYRAGFTLLAGMAGLGSLFFLLAKHPRHKRARPSPMLEVAD